MKVKEYAEKNDITIEEAKEQTGCTHWNQTIPETCDKVVDEVEDVIETAKDLLKESQDVMKLLMGDGITAKMALTGIVLIGGKSKYAKYAKVLETLVD